MLTRSFVHIPGIGTVKEKMLWSKGVADWSDLRKAVPEFFRDERASRITQFIGESERAYSERDFGFFFRNLPRDQLWRLVPECQERVAYLDIETTGLGFPPLSHSTTITFYFQGKVYQEVEHERKRALLEMISAEAALIVSYFGEVFDVPFLEEEFATKVAVPHLDLCFWLKRLGYSGGLKRIQKRFPEIPARESMDISGYDAVKLWALHLRGVPGALDTLLTYNAEDTIVLEPLLVRAFNLEIERHPHLGLKPLASRSLPNLATRVYPEVYGLLRDSQSIPVAPPGSESAS